MVDFRVQLGLREDMQAERLLKRIRHHHSDHSESLQSFVPLPSNLDALEATLLFTSGYAPFVAITGPSGWGKSHLLQVAQERVAQNTQAKPDIQSVATLAKNGLRWDHPAPLLLDDAQTSLTNPRDRFFLRNMIELRSKLHRPTFVCFTEQRPRHSLEVLLPSVKNWSLLTVGAPSFTERQVILCALAESAELQLSERLIRILSRLLSGDGRAIKGALQRLELMSESWKGLRGELQALGAVEPFLRHEWNLIQFVDRILIETIEPLALQICTDFQHALSLHVLRRECGLGEEALAHAFSMEPGDVFSHVQTFDSALSDARVARLHAVCLAALDEALDQF